MARAQHLQPLPHLQLGSARLLSHQAQSALHILPYLAVLLLVQVETALSVHLGRKALQPTVRLLPERDI